MKSSQLQIRVSPEQKKTFQEAARLENLDFSSWALSKLSQDVHVQWAQKLEALVGGNTSFALADLGDFLQRRSTAEIEQILKQPWATPLSEMLSNYVAAMLELCAHRHQLQTPAWLKNIEPLQKPYFATELQSLHLYLLQNSPAPFKMRNLFIDTTFEGRV